MRFIISLFMLQLFFIFFCHTSFAENVLSKLEPPQDKVLLIIGQDNKTIETYIDDTGNIPGGFMIYTSIQDMDGLNYISKDYGSGTFYADELLNKYPFTVIQIGLYMVDALSKTYEGLYDDNIVLLAGWLKKVKVPVYLRIGYEFNGPHNHHDPEEYKKAYCYLVDKLKDAGVNNTAYVWHAHGHQVEPDLIKWYPGDAYVDWIGLSYFSQPEDMMEPVIAFAKKYNKPVMIGEATPKGMSTSLDKTGWEAWYKLFFKFVKKHNIKAISYINSNWEDQPMWVGQGWGDARVQANEYIKEHWLEEINKDIYLKSTDKLFKQLGYE
ncbi:MAG: hypothetical protein KAI43_08630 [Candidatus Aureabacteria bacterium]|nr:hypothetical protein [Candidatus Auribacterota bacterium]